MVRGVWYTIRRAQRERSAHLRHARTKLREALYLRVAKAKVVIVVVVVVVVVVVGRGRGRGRGRGCGSWSWWWSLVVSDGYGPEWWLWS